MCGATSQQTELEAAQSNFYNTLTANYNAAFGAESGILKTLSAELTPIFEKGPDQEGFGAGEKTALETEATEGTAQGLSKTRAALADERAAMGGDNFIPSGQTFATDAMLTQGALNQRSAEETQITEADYATGRQIWQGAAEGLGKVAAQWDPNGGANAATGAGSAASTTANEIAQENNSVWQSVIGGISGIAGQAAGGATLGATMPSH